jgi:transcriptional regulator with XRE-family HTH domain
MNIGPRIKAIREAKKAKYGNKYTAAACAERSGMGKSRWFDIEADRCSPTLQVLERVADALGTSVAVLVRVGK